MISRFFARDPTPVSPIIICRDSDRPCRRHRLPKRLPSLMDLALWQLQHRLCRLSISNARPPCLIGCIWSTMVAAVVLPCRAHFSHKGCGTAWPRVASSICRKSRSGWPLCLCGGCYSRGLSWAGADHSTCLHIALDSRGICMVSLASLAWVSLPSAEHLLQLVFDDVPQLLCIGDFPVSHISSNRKAPAGVSLWRPFCILCVHYNDIIRGH